MKKKMYVVAIVFYAIVVLIATKALLDRNEYGVFATKNNYYICNDIIKEYDASSLVRFDRNANYEKLVNEDVYYFDDNDKLQNGKLSSFDKESGVFSILDVSYEKDKLLGRPDKAYQIVGSILNIITSRAFYLIFVIIPFIGLFVYEIYLFVKYLSHGRNGKELDNDKKTTKKNK